MSTRRGFPEPLPPEKGQGGAFRTVLWETYPHPRGKNGRGHISHVRIQKKKVCRNTRCAFFFFIDYKNRLIFLSCDILRISLIYAFSTSK